MGEPGQASSRVGKGPDLAASPDEEARRGSILPIVLAAFVPAALFYRPSPTPVFLGGPEFAAFGAQNGSEWAREHLVAALPPPREYPYWRPLESAGLWVIAILSREGPEGYFVAKALLHGAAALLVGLLARRLARSVRHGAVAAAVFAVHPVASHATNYLVAFNEHFVTIGACGALLLFLRALGAGSPLAQAGSVLSFAAALFSKEVAIVVPLLAVGAGLAAGCRPIGRVLRKSIPLFLLAGAYLGVRVLVRLAAGNDPVAVLEVSSLGTVLGNVFVRPWEAVLFPVNPAALPEWTPVLRWFPLAAIAVALAGSLLRRPPSWRLVSFGLAYAWVAAAPGGGYLPAAGAGPFLWRFYYPSAGAALAFAGLLLPARGRPAGRGRGGLLPVALVLCLLSVCTEANSGAWREARRVLGKFGEELSRSRPPEREEGLTVLVLTNAPLRVRGVGTGAGDVVFCAATWFGVSSPDRLRESRPGGIPLRLVVFDDEREIDGRDLSAQYGKGVRWYGFRWDRARRELRSVGSGRTG